MILMYKVKIMNCIALYDSGNYAYRVCRIFERKGLVFEVVSTPCKISSTGCGYSLLFPETHLRAVLSESLACGCPAREVYRIVDRDMRKDYIRIR